MDVRKTPRGTFLVGAFVAAALALPLLTLALESVSQVFHVGPTTATRAQLLTFAAIFAGFPVFVTGGGVARLVAHRLAESPAPRVGRGVLLAAVAMGIAGVGAALLIIVPAGGLPEEPATWWPLLLAGLAVGVVTGAALGLLVAGRAVRHRQRAAV